MLNSTPRFGGFKLNSSPRFGGLKLNSTPRFGGFKLNSTPRFGGFKLNSTPRFGWFKLNSSPRFGGFKLNSSPRFCGLKLNIADAATSDGPWNMNHDHATTEYRNVIMQDQRRRRMQPEGFQCGERSEKDDGLTFVSEFPARVPCRCFTPT